MSYSNRYSGEITITPPLNVAEIRGFTALYDWSDSFDAHLRIDRDESVAVEGESVLITITETADAIVGPDEPCNGHDVQAQIQAIIDMFPGHEFAGHIQVDWDPGFGEPPVRYVVRDRRVVEVKPQMVWPGDEDGA